MQKGADALLVVTPYYNKCTQKGLLAALQGRSLIMWISRLSYITFPQSGWISRPKHMRWTCQASEWQAAVKEASGDCLRLWRSAACGIDLAIYSGNDASDADLPNGRRKAFLCLSIVAPKVTHDICQLYFEESNKRVCRSMDRLADLIELFSYSSIRFRSHGNASHGLCSRTASSVKSGQSKGKINADVNVTYTGKQAPKLGGNCQFTQNDWAQLMSKCGNSSG